MKNFIPSLFYGKKSAYLQPKIWKKFSLSKGLHSGLYALKNKSPHFLCRFRSTLNTSKSHLLQFVYIRKANKKTTHELFAHESFGWYFIRTHRRFWRAVLKPKEQNRLGFELFVWNLKANTYSIDLSIIKWYNMHV